jgi:hypothetical protein
MATCDSDDRKIPCTDCGEDRTICRQQVTVCVNRQAELERKAAICDELAAALKKLIDVWFGAPFRYDYLSKPMQDAQAALAHIRILGGPETKFPLLEAAIKAAEEG